MREMTGVKKMSFTRDELVMKLAARLAEISDEFAELRKVKMADATVEDYQRADALLDERNATLRLVKSLY